MDFTYCSQVILDKFFPVTIEEKYSKIPPSFRSSPAEIRNFQLRVAKNDKDSFLKNEMDLFDKIENKSIISHAGNTGNDKCNGITLHFLRYIAERATPFKESETGFKHLIREAIVEFGVRVTRNSKEWDKDVEIIGALL